MVEKIGTIRNPLTIIAIFAAIAEISGTIVLPLLAERNQATYIWFLMIFPTLLIILFFTTLLIQPTALYAPSDYQSDSNFLNSIQRLQKATVSERIEKRQVAQQASTQLFLSQSTTYYSTRPHR